MGGASGELRVSLTLPSSVPPHDEVPSPRRAVREVPAQAAVEPDPVVPVAETIPAGWYTDPAGNAQLRWWDGSAWTANLVDAPPALPELPAPDVAGVEAAPAALESPTPSRPSTPPSEAPSSAIVTESAPLPVEPAEPAEAVEPAEPVAPLPAGPVAPLSRRQIRELVGPLTNGPPDAESPIAAGAARTSSSVFDRTDSVASTNGTDSTEAVDSTGGVDRDDPALSARVTAATAFLDPAELIDSSSGRSWIGSGPPLVVSPPGPEETVVFGTPSGVEPPVSSSVRPFGLSLPPDPFALPGAAGTFRSEPPVWVTGPLLPASARARSTTWAVWAFALVPALLAAGAWLALSRLHLAAAVPLQIGLIAASVILSLVFAATDRRMLRRREFDRTAPTALAIIPPLYLLVRAIRVGAAGIAPLLVWLLIQAASVVFLLLQAPAVVAFLPVGATHAISPPAVASGPLSAAARATELTPTGMAAALTAQTLAKNLHFDSISCPTLASTVDGTSATCVGTLASVKLNLNVVVDSSLPNSAFALVSEAPAA